MITELEQRIADRQSFYEWKRALMSELIYANDIGQCAKAIARAFKDDSIPQSYHSSVGSIGSGPTLGNPTMESDGTPLDIG